MEENGINLNFHQFDSPFKSNNSEEEKLVFTFLNNREKDLKKSGISVLYSILSTEYDKVDHAVSTTLKHKIVFLKIEEISKRNVNIPKKNERAKKNSFFDFVRSFSNERDFENTIKSKEKREQEEAFIEVPDLLKKLNEKNDLNEIFERKEIETILEDLYKLGLIIYFKKKSLSDTIISNPQWFNNVFKSILDFGRKNVEIIIESIYNKLKETKNKKMKEEFEKTVNWLKGNSKLEKISEIWENNQELEISNLDKISYENILIKLEENIAKLIEQKESSIFEEIEELKNLNYSSISQTFIFIEENILVIEVINKVLEKYRMKGDKFFKPKKEFLMNILSQFDFMIPTKRLKYKLDGKIIRNERTFVVPLLFPSFKPLSSSNMGLTKKNEDWNNIEFENEWIVNYFLPFKPSAVWKLLFMRIRGFCVGLSESEREMVEEIYWLNGFSFYLIENDATKVKTFLELEFVENENKSGQVLMKITIKTDLNDLNLFYSSLHQTIQAFVKEWIVSEICNKINIKIIKKKENKFIGTIQQSFIISEDLQLKDEIEQYSSNDKNEEIDIIKETRNDKFKCFNCGFTISLSDLKDNTCDKCEFFFFIN